VTIQTPGSTAQWFWEQLLRRGRLTTGHLLAGHLLKGNAQALSFFLFKSKKESL
jgi:hypothetical protein